ncbi:IclR family transcriptional regulator [Pararhodobacter oceanensis]|uniref:IclR family transcriptional regulator n=1 Tax=Pararhodobacter oceanensis TaxID=2172121 RepID=UPI003A8D0487
MILYQRLDQDDKEVSSTFAKGLSVITAFDGSNRELTISEIATKMQLNRAAIRRLIRTLEQLGFVSHDRGRYQLTPRVLRLSRGFLETRSIPQVVQPVLRRVSHEIGESVSLAMPDGDEAVYVAHAFVPNRFSLNMVTVGSRVPAAPTAVGRAILAFLEPEDREAILDSLSLSAHTANTLVGRKELAAALDTIRRCGYSLSASEYVEGVSSLALPVFGGERQVLGAVSIVFPSGQYEEQELKDRVFGLLQRAAEDIGAVL